MKKLYEKFTPQYGLMIHRKDFGFHFHITKTWSGISISIKGFWVWICLMFVVKKISDRHDRESKYWNL